MKKTYAQQLQAQINKTVFRQLQNNTKMRQTHKPNHNRLDMIWLCYETESEKVHDPPTRTRTKIRLPSGKLKQSDNREHHPKLKPSNKKPTGI